MAGIEYEDMNDEAPKKVVTRTPRQNRALHKWMTMVANELNAAGLDQRKVLKPGISIPWTQKAVKEQLWKPIQRAMFSKVSTTELGKMEVGEVEQVLARHLAEKFSFQTPEWPHFENENDYLKETTSTTPIQSDIT